MIFAVFDLSLLTLQLFLVFLGDRFWSPYDIGPLSVLFVTLMHCGQTVGWIKMLLGMEVGLGPGHIVLDRDPAPVQQRGTARLPQFSAHVSCGQTAGWIKMPLGREVDLGPGDGHCVRRGPSSPPKGYSLPNFRPMTVVAKRMNGSRCHLVWR